MRNSRKTGRAPYPRCSDASIEAERDLTLKLVRRAVTGIAAFVLAAIAVAGCASSSKQAPSSTASPASPAGTTARASSSTSAATPGAAKGTPFALGTLCSCSGTQAAALARVPDAAQAWADSINASGGINGHPIKMIVKDDAGNPATGLQQIKELVTQDHVMAIVGETSLTDQSWAPYVQQQGIPVVGGSPFEASFSSSPDFFISGTGLPVLTVGAMEQAKQNGVKKVGLLYCAESPVCKQLDPLGQAAAKIAGVGYTSLAVSATAPSYAAPCLALKSSGVDGLFIADNATVVQRVTAACAQQGYKPNTINEMATIAPNWLHDPNLDGALLVGSNANYVDTSLPAVNQFLAAIDKRAPGLTSQASFSAALLNVWAGGELFKAAAQAAHLTPSSPPSAVKHGLYALKNETLGALAPPLNFQPGKPGFPTCYFSMKLQAGKLASLNDGKTSCVSAAQVGALAKILGG
jgi:branched-chain amino acid transport system substrate-binding protein